MNFDRFKFGAAAAVLGLLTVLACENRAQADTLVLGGDYNPFAWTLTNGPGPGTQTVQNEGGGSIDPSTLNGHALPYIYCIDIPDQVGAPGTYSNTAVTNDGTARYSTTNTNHQLNTFATANTLTGGDFVYAGGSLTKAEQIAWLVTNLAPAAIDPTNSPDANNLLQEGLQAAIWKTVYGSAFTVQDSAVNTQMQTDLTALGANLGNVGSLDWLTPGGSTGSTVYQALVTVATPEPSSLAIAGLGALGFLGYSLKRRKNS